MHPDPHRIICTDTASPGNHSRCRLFPIPGASVPDATAHHKWEASNGVSPPRSHPPGSGCPSPDPLPGGPSPDNVRCCAETPFHKASSASSPPAQYSDAPYPAHPDCASARSYQSVPCFPSDIMLSPCYLHPSPTSAFFCASYAE